MKKSLRWVLRVSLVLLGVLFALFLLKDAIIKSMAERRLCRKTGLRVTIGQLKVGLISATLALKDLKVFNPPGFGSAILLSISEASCGLDLPQARSNRVHFHELKLHLAELNVIKNRDGLLNLSSAQDSILSHTPQESPKTGKLVFKFGGIDKLDLTLEKVSYIDEQHPGNSRHFDLGVNSGIVTNLQTDEDFNRWLTAFLIRTAFQEYRRHQPSTPNHQPTAAPIALAAPKFVCLDCFVEIFRYSAMAVAAYLLGSIPTGFLMAKARGIDIRGVGSGNIGATNVSRALGKPAGIFVLVFDGLKGYAACEWLADLMLSYFGGKPDDRELLKIIGGVLAVLGHNYTCWLKFKGGKGIATSAGVLAALVPFSLLIILIVWIVVLALTRYVSLASIAASVSLPFATWLTGKSLTLILVTSAMTVLAIYKHKANIERLLKGTESRFGSKKTREGTS